MRRDGGGMEWCRVEGGMGSSAHSPELIIARVLVITHVPVVTRVLVVTVSSSLVSRGGRFGWWWFGRASWFVGDGERRSSVVVVVACVVP